MEQTGGDGIDIGGLQSLMSCCEKDGLFCDSTNILVTNVHLLNNYRNAVSITGGINVTIADALLANTSGTCCMGGTDLEPETPYRHISNVTFRNVTFASNAMTQVSPGAIDCSVVLALRLYALTRWCSI